MLCFADLGVHVAFDGTEPRVAKGCRCHKSGSLQGVVVYLGMHEGGGSDFGDMSELTGHYVASSGRSAGCL